MDQKKYRVELFGKKGCAKCKVLGQRLDKVLEQTAWEAFEKKYHDVETEEGILTFCDAECVNPQRIPALLVKRLDEASGDYLPVENRSMGQADSVCGSTRLYQYVGMQTDYSDAGKGIITPKMIKHVLQAAMDE